MPRIAKFMLFIALLVLLVVPTGCNKVKKGTASPEDYFPLILIALDGGKTAAMIGRNEFIEKKDFAGCVSMEALIASFDAAGDVLAGKMQDKIVIPAIEIELTACMEFHGGTPKGREDLEQLIEGVAGVALTTADFYANKLKQTDCKKGTAALGAIKYLKGMVQPIADQVAKPGSMISIPAVEISFADCG